MELKEAQKIFNDLKGSKTFNQMNHLGLGFVANAGVILNNRITELEAQRDVPRKTLRMLVDILENIHIEELRAELAKYGKDLPRFKDIIGLYADKAEASDKEE